jgi:hypothetical protein
VENRYVRLKSVEECTIEEREALAVLKNTLSLGRGIPVGVLGSIARPVFLVQGELVLFRNVPATRRSYAYDISQLLASQFRSISAPFFIETNKQHDLWYARRFFEHTLEDEELPSELTRPQLVKSIVEVFTPLISARKVHGHVCPSNLAYHKGELFLLDGGLHEGLAVTLQEEWEVIVAHSVKLLMPLLTRGEMAAIQRKGLSATTIQEKMLWLESLDPQPEKVNEKIVSSTRVVTPPEQLHLTPKEFVPEPTEERLPVSRGAPRPSLPPSNSGFLFLVAVVIFLGAALIYRNVTPRAPVGDDGLLTGWARGDLRSIGEVLDRVAQDPNSSLVGTVEKDFSREIPWGFEIDPRPYFQQGVGKVSHTPEDISAAIAMSIRREDLLNESRLSDLSPVGVLYVCGALERPLTIANADSIRKLQVLPPPLGAMFQLAGKLGESSKISDTKLRVLCRISWGVSNSVPEPLIAELLTFSGKEQAQTKAAIMLLILSRVSELNVGIAPAAREVLRTTNYAELVARDKWFTEFTDIWGNVKGSIILELIAGSYPETKSLSVEALTDLVSYPHAEISSAAKKSVIEQMPGIQKEGVGNALVAPKLSRVQKMLLVAALKSPQDVQYGFFQKWLNSEPDPSTVLTILSKGGFPESFNITAVRYLQSKKLPVSMKILPDLLVHPDKVVRAFGYALIPTDTQAGMELLKKAIGFEKDPALKGRLEGLLRN